MMPASPPAVVVATGDALVVVDVQNDFLPGGALAVPKGDAAVPALNRYLSWWRDKGLPVYATRDWHPAEHCSFRAHGGPWPVHCVAGTRGAEFAPSLDLPNDAIVISKGASRERDAYSGFDGTDLHERLRRAGIRRVFVGGLATDYCVLATVKDALRLGYAVYVLGDAIQAVNVRRDDGAKAEAEMARAGAVNIRYEQIGS
ncbi:MAG: nicotinamidase [Nitrospirota bacterium]